MKLKYYLNENLIGLIIISLIITAAVILINPASAYTLDSSSVKPTAILKCQPVSITANFTGAITSVDVFINNTQQVMTLGGYIQSSNEQFTMTDNGGGNWSYTYGNNANIIWGNKSITFEVTVGAVVTKETTNNYVMVYSDTCTGTGMSSYQNLSLGFGNYTNKFFNGEATLIDFALNPWIEYLGYVFYIFVIFWISLIVYMKNQNIVQPLIILFTSLGALVTTTWLPPEYKPYIIMIMALGLGGMFYKVFKS
jgi:hypothetical protein